MQLLQKTSPLNEQRMPFSYGLLDGLYHEAPVVGSFARSSLPQGGLSNEMPGV